MIFGGPAGAPMFVLLSFLTAADPAAGIAQFGGTLQVALRRLTRSQWQTPRPKATTLLIEFDKGKTGFLLTVDPATKLISSIEMKVDPEQFSRGLPNGQEISIEQFGWKAGAIATELPKDHTFAYEAPKGFAKVDSLTEREDPKDHPLTRQTRARIHADGAGRTGEDEDDHQGRAGGKGRRDRLLGHVVRAVHAGAARDPEADRGVRGFQERRGDRRPEPGRRARGTVASSQARREDAGREEVHACRRRRWG